MPRPTDLQTEDFEPYDVLEYQCGKFLDDGILDGWSEMVGAINRAEELAPRIGKLEMVTDEMVKLRGGSYVRLRWQLEVVPAQEAEEEIKAAAD